MTKIPKQRISFVVTQSSEAKKPATVVGLRPPIAMPIVRRSFAGILSLMPQRVRPVMMAIQSWKLVSTVNRPALFVGQNALKSRAGCFIAVMGRLKVMRFAMRPAIHRHAILIAQKPIAVTDT
jgi:hypothetical protein